MNKFEEQSYYRYIEIFDKLNVNGEYERRIFFKPLYDYLMCLVFDIGTNYCNLDSRSLKVGHLLTRWSNVKSCLSIVQNVSDKEDVIIKTNKLRGKIEHNDSFFPRKTDIQSIRNKIPEFYNFIVDIGIKYLKQSKNFTFKKHLYFSINKTLIEAESIIYEFNTHNDNIPYIFQFEFGIKKEDNDYHNFIESIKQLNIRKEDIRKLDEIRNEDIDKLIQIEKKVTEIRTREEYLITQGNCPICGEDITETHHTNYTGPYDDPEPDSIDYRVGCKNCEYTLHSETY